MSNANFAIPKAYNEPVKAYLPGSPEREALKKNWIVRLPFRLKFRSSSAAKSTTPATKANVLCLMTSTTFWLNTTLLVKRN